MNVLHLVDNVDKVNFGIWNAALINSSYLKTKGWVSYAAFPKQDFKYNDVISLPFSNHFELLELMEVHHLEPKNTVIVSHGYWS